MRKLFGVLLVLALVLSFSMVATTPVAAATITVGPTGDYATIQEAVDNANDGDTIVVAPGTYIEAVEIDVPNLTLESSGGRDVTTIENPNVGSETPGIRVLANLGVVTVEGFTVKHFRNGISQGMGSSEGTAFIVKNNRVVPEPGYLRNGIQVSGEGSQVIGNYVVGAPLTADWASSGIHVVNAKNVLVEGNVVNTGGADIGIAITNWSAALVEDITVHLNEVHGAWDGIRITGPSGQQRDVQGVVLDSNVLSECDWGINIQAVTLEDVTITNNQIHDGSRGLRFGATTALAGTVAVNYNSIYGNTEWGLLNGTGVLVDATFNWWGDASGPFHDVTNVDGQGDQVSDDVDYTPWYFLEDPEYPVVSYDDVGTETGTGTAKFGTSAGEFVDLQAVPAVSPAPRGVSFPHGMFEFEITGLSLGETIILVIEFPDPIPAGTVWWKHDGSSWYSLTNLRDNGDNIMEIELTDGGLGDLGPEDGTILDPGGPGNPMTPLTVGWEGSAVNKAAVMAPWIALSALIAGASVFALRRRRAQI